MNWRSIPINSKNVLAIIVAIFIVVLPFHAFLTVWASSLVGHYTLLRLWKEVLLALAVLLASAIMWRSPVLRRQVVRDWIWRLSALYVLVMIVWGLAAYALHAVTANALLYGELVNDRLFVIMFVAWVAAHGASWLYRYWARLLLLPAIGVIAIALLQRFALPYDVMKHFGYSDATISPYQTIDHKVSYIRIRSTLRGANLLGAYMIPVISASLQRLSQFSRHRVEYAGLLVAAVTTLAVSGSRGAWLGTGLATIVVVWLQLASSRLRRYILLAATALVIVLAASLVVLRDNDFVQNTFFHTDEYSTSSVSSNDAHLDAAVSAARQVVHEPLGRGPGSAGPASVYNGTGKGRIAENYFLQIGQETGWLGLGLIIAIFVLLARALWQRRQDGLARVLFASLLGLSVVAMLMHIWTDDTLAYVWFSLVGIALARPPKDTHAKTA